MKISVLPTFLHFFSFHQVRSYLETREISPLSPNLPKDLAKKRSSENLTLIFYIVSHKVLSPVSYSKSIFGAEETVHLEECLSRIYQVLDSIPSLV